MKWLAAGAIIVVIVMIAFLAPVGIGVAAGAVGAGFAIYGAKKALDAYEERDYSITIGKKRGEITPVQIIEAGPIQVEKADLSPDTIRNANRRSLDVYEELGGGAYEQ